MKRGLGDALMSAGALMILAIALIAFDQRVRDYAWRFMNRASVANARVEIGDVGSVIFVALRDQSMAHAPLTIFVIAGAILFLFMVKT